MTDLPEGVEPVEPKEDLGDPAKFTWQEDDEPQTEEKTDDAEGK